MGARRFLFMWVAGVLAGALAFSGCVFGPKHEDPGASADGPPGDEAGVDTGALTEDTLTPKEAEPPPVDASPDWGGTGDTSLSPDVAPDVAPDASPDASPDAPDAGDAPADGPSDATRDAVTDAESEASAETGPDDAAIGDALDADALEGGG